MARSSYRISEQETPIYTFTLKDEEGAPIAASSLTTATLTLYAVPSGTILNSRNGQSILNTNNVTISELGVVTWTLQVNDVKILDDTKRIEVHRALFLFTWGSNRSKPHEVDLEIDNLGKLL